MVSLTGSIATGANIISSTADSVKRMHMELGGKAPVIIFDDADIDAAVEGIRTFGFYNAGQDCTAACRIYAQEGIYENSSRSSARPSAASSTACRMIRHRARPLITAPSTATASPGLSNAPWRSRTSA
jgi:acyl-CoA reductase-like NAD-dependent aldehyde dehydrogenase